MSMKVESEVKRSIVFMNTNNSINLWDMKQILIIRKHSNPKYTPVGVVFAAIYLHFAYLEST